MNWHHFSFLKAIGSIGELFLGGRGNCPNVTDMTEEQCV
jgi:hypothetical protein